MMYAERIVQDAQALVRFHKDLREELEIVVGENTFDAIRRMKDELRTCKLAAESAERSAKEAIERATKLEESRAAMVRERDEAVARADAAEADAKLWRGATATLPLTAEALGKAAFTTLHRPDLYHADVRERWETLAVGVARSVMAALGSDAAAKVLAQKLGVDFESAFAAVGTAGPAWWRAVLEEAAKAALALPEPAGGWSWARNLTSADLETYARDYVRDGEPLVIGATPQQTEPEPERCEVCDWPLSAKGCAPGNCSYRPREGSDEHKRIKERRAALAQRKAEERLAEVADQQAEERLAEFAKQQAEAPKLEWDNESWAYTSPDHPYYSQRRDLQLRRHVEALDARLRKLEGSR